MMEISLHQLATYFGGLFPHFLILFFENFLSFTSVIFSLSPRTDTSPTEVLTDQE